METFRRFVADIGLASTVAKARELYHSRDTNTTLEEISKMFSRFNRDITPLDMMAAVHVLSRAEEVARSAVLPSSGGRRLTVESDGDLAWRAARAVRHAAASYGWQTVYELTHGGASPPTSASPRLSDADYDQQCHKLSVAAISDMVDGVTADDVLDSRWTGSTFDPAHYVCYDALLGAVVVSVPGTRSADDVIADVHGSPEPFGFDRPDFGFGRAHLGVARCAYAKIEQIERVLVAALEKYSPVERKLVMTGHSLGGGIVALIALMLADSHKDWNIEVFGFGPASTLCEELARSQLSQAVIRSFVFRDDIVPHINWGSLEFSKLLFKQVVQQARTLANTPPPPQSPSPATSPQLQSSTTPPPMQQQAATPQGGEETAGCAVSWTPITKKQFGILGWLSEKVLGRVDVAAAALIAREEFHKDNLASKRFVFPAGRLFWILPLPSLESPSSTCVTPDPPQQQQETAIRGTPEIMPPPALVASPVSQAPEEVTCFEVATVDWLKELPMSSSCLNDHRLINYVTSICHLSDSLSKPKP